MHVTTNHRLPAPSYIFIMSEHMTRAWLDISSYPSNSNVGGETEKEILD
jgi:hypothetical protein